MKTLLTGNAASTSQSNLPQSNKEWQAWGERDPLYGVIPQPGRERDGATPWTDEEFYQTGRNDWEELLQRWRRYGVERESCVEIGCGAGRLTRHIAQDFAEVHGLDVAAGMIDYARQHVPANVHLHMTNGTSLPVPDHSVTAVFSVIVFLHFDRIEYAAAYFREMARALKPGGTIMIQMPLHQWPGNLKPIVRGWFASAHSAYMALRRSKGWYHRFRLSRHQWSPFMQSITYDAAWVHETLSSLGFRDIETCSFQLSRGGAVYSWVFARKASQE
jgi:ubiquinone/menaquinone biosynthesis C-methylase UbiE